MSIAHKVWIKKHVLRLPVLQFEWNGGILPLASIKPERVEYTWMPMQIVGLEIANGYPMNLGGSFYPNGLGMHAETQAEFLVPPKADRLVGMAGRVDRGHACRRHATEMAVLVDGKIVWSAVFLGREDSPIHLQPVPKQFDVNVRGARSVTLFVGAGGDGIDCDHCSWGDPTFLLGW
jgi:alpha-galactosidase